MSQASTTPILHPNPVVPSPPASTSSLWINKKHRAAQVKTSVTETDGRASELQIIQLLLYRPVDTTRKKQLMVNNCLAKAEQRILMRRFPVFLQSIWAARSLHFVAKMNCRNASFHSEEVLPISLTRAIINTSPAHTKRQPESKWSIYRLQEDLQASLRQYHACVYIVYISCSIEEGGF